MSSQAGSVAHLAGEWPRAPEELTEAQRLDWDVIVRTKPSDWFGPDTYPLLIAYVRAMHTGDVISTALNEFQPSWILEDAGLKRFEKLTRLQSANVRNLAMLATKMRLAQQSRYEQKVAATASRQVGTGAKPWEVAKSDSPEGDATLNG